MTIPRRLGADIPRLSPKWTLLSLLLDVVLLTLDTTAWVLTIMIAPAPFILSGLLEVIIDYKVTRCTTIHQPISRLPPRERVQLLTAVLAGNLAIEGVPVNPQRELDGELNVTKHGDAVDEETKVRLCSMLDCQFPFGAAVGAPILLYIGSFIFSLVSLAGTLGDKGAARALAFGIWWMTIVHVSAIRHVSHALDSSAKSIADVDSLSGSLLSSNNPSTAAAIVRRQRIVLTVSERLQYADTRSQLEDRIQARVEAYSRIPLIYKSRFEPVWMWTRGKNKAAWIKGTMAWRKSWFRDYMEMSGWAWLLLTLVAYLLVLIPCILAFWIEYATPVVEIGCRALTILVYACAQLVFVVLSAWSHVKAVQEEDYWERHRWLNRLRRKWVGVLVTVLLLLPAWIAAVFTTFAGTLMQITGIFQNCICSATHTWTFPIQSTVSLATDTAEDRQSSKYWSIAGYIALGFLACITYLGWWCQRNMRDVFMERVNDLVGSPDDEPDKNGATMDLAAPYTRSEHTVSGTTEEKIHLEDTISKSVNELQKCHNHHPCDITTSVHDSQHAEQAINSSQIQHTAVEV
ncbi:uncharacterized protein KY384_000926 [Bacidia gigantensis]|uniref:uncharacterized protein n=1 Tax=Bacidia gigantensis TaxID=2732470 RepID=UPI001D0518E8|nr:uncharacterized protein KY384_000926 [Bacidia gigantensis]KAG8534083.1 hypothetical protein KY384_000926 [Bacidia gigantensis]